WAMGVEFQKAHGPWTLSSAHGRAMSQSTRDSEARRLPTTTVDVKRHW
ncbi:hypothetical protein AAEP93_008372, partial [Penicillium crustosum]